MKTILAGTLAACFQSFADLAQIKPLDRIHGLTVQRQRKKKRNKIGNALGVTERVLYRWCAGESEPLYIDAMKLVFALESLGYNVTNKGPKERRQLLKAIALGVTSIEEVSRILDYKNDNSVTNFIFGKCNSIDRKELILTDLLKKLDSEIEAKATEFANKFRELSGLEDQPEPQSEIPAVAPVSFDNSDPDAVVALASSHIMALIPLAQNLLDDNSPRGKTRREKLLSSTRMGASNGVFEVSNLLFPLCSENARKQAGSEKQIKGGFAS